MQASQKATVITGLAKNHSTADTQSLRLGFDAFSEVLGTGGRISDAILKADRAIVDAEAERFAHSYLGPKRNQISWLSRVITSFKLRKRIRHGVAVGCNTRVEGLTA